MKLPDFGAFEPFLDLKKSMDARAPVTFSAEFSARQISNDNFTAQEALAMPPLEDFVTPRAKRPEPLALPQATPSEEPPAQTIVLPQPTGITEPEKTAADPVVITQPQSRAKLRPARHDKQKKSAYHRRSILMLTLAAGGILLLNAALLWVFFSYLATITKPVSSESPPVIAQPQPVPPPQKLEEVAPKPAPAAPPPVVLAPPPAPQPQQAQPEPPVTLFPEPELAAPEPLPEPQQPTPPEPMQAAPTPAPHGAPLYPVQPSPRPSVFDGQPPSNLPSAGGIGGVGAGWGGQGGSAGLAGQGGSAGMAGQGGSAGLAGQGGVGGIGGVGAPGVGSGQAATPPANLRFRRVYVRHYVRVPPPPPEDIPADQLPWEKP